MSVVCGEDFDGKQRCESKSNFEIAREMRKYNVTLLVVDQRPSAIDNEVLSQIGTKLACLLDDEKGCDCICDIVRTMRKADREGGNDHEEAIHLRHDEDALHLALDPRGFLPHIFTKEVNAVFLGIFGINEFLDLLPPRR